MTKDQVTKLERMSYEKGLEDCIEIVEDWYTINPKYRTKEKLLSKINKESVI